MSGSGLGASPQLHREHASVDWLDKPKAKRIVRAIESFIIIPSPTESLPREACQWSQGPVSGVRGHFLSQTHPTPEIAGGTQIDSERREKRPDRLAPNATRSGISLAKACARSDYRPVKMKQFQFTLFIAGESPRSQRAIANLKRIAQDRLGGDYELTVVDVQQEPERAEEERILTTPTLVKRAPEPRRRVTGDLTNAEQVLIALALLPDEDS